MLLDLGQKLEDHEVVRAPRTRAGAEACLKESPLLWGACTGISSHSHFNRLTQVLERLWAENSALDRFASFQNLSNPHDGTDRPQPPLPRGCPSEVVEQACGDMSVVRRVDAEHEIALKYNCPGSLLPVASLPKGVSVHLHPRFFCSRLRTAQTHFTRIDDRCKRAFHGRAMLGAQVVPLRVYGRLG